MGLSTKTLSIILMTTLTGLLIMSVSIQPGCFKGQSNLVTLSLWHNFGGPMQSAMDSLVDEFNRTVGREKDIVIDVVSITGSATIKEKLAMIAADDPGAPEMPDIASCYPQTAILLQKKGLIAPLDDHFSDKELAAYVPQFLEEGEIDGKLYVFPFAKSTEVLFVNKTLFDEFSRATNVELEELSTFEGIANAASKYYLWTDAQTPEIANDGKHFYTADSLFNLAQVGMVQLGSSLFDGRRLWLGSPEYQHICSTFFETAVQGGYAICYGYSSDLARTGEIVCSTGSTAGILFYGEEIIFPDNTTLPVEYTVLPFPTFVGGNKVAIQRGSGLIIAKSIPAKEKAAAIFLKWFTSPKQNMEFVASTGYLPVTNEAFYTCVPLEIVNSTNVNIRKLLETAIKVHRDYDFYTPPIFTEFDKISGEYERRLKELMEGARENYSEYLGEMDIEEACKKALVGMYETFNADD